MSYRAWLRWDGSQQWSHLIMETETEIKYWCSLLNLTGGLALSSKSVYNCKTNTKETQKLFSAQSLLALLTLERRAVFLPTSQTYWYPSWGLYWQGRVVKVTLITLLNGLLSPSLTITMQEISRIEVSLIVRFVPGVGQPVFTLCVRHNSQNSQTDKILNLDNSSSHFQCWSG